LSDTNATVNLANNVSDANNDIVLSTFDIDPSTAGIQNTRTTADGVWSITNRGVVTFNPNADFEGAAVTAYTVQDNDGNQSVAMNIAITVGGASPIGTPVSATVEPDANAVVDLADSVSDANNING